MKKYYHSPSNVGIIDAAQRGDVNAVKAILQVNPECMTMRDERGYTAFHWAAYSDDIEVFSLLVAVNEIALWNLKTLKGQNALHIACSNGSQRVVNRILEVVSNITDHIDEVNQHGETPLHLAAAANYTELVERLLNCGANATLKDQWGRTAQKVAIENGYTKTGKAISDIVNDGQHENNTREIGADGSDATTASRTAVAQLPSVFAVELKAKLAPSTARSVGYNNFGLHHTVPVERHMFEDTNVAAHAGHAAQVAPTSESTADGTLLSPLSEVSCPLEMDRTGATASTSTSAPVPAPVKPKTALSKLVEFPGDPVKLKAYLDGDSVSLNGKDMYGLTALMKFAAWDKVDLLHLLLPRLSAEEVNITGGKQKLPLLHYCVDMDAVHTLSALLRDTRIDQGAVDEHGRTFREHAVYHHKQTLLDAVFMS